MAEIDDTERCGHPGKAGDPTRRPVARILLYVTYIILWAVLVLTQRHRLEVESLKRTVASGIDQEASTDTDMPRLFPTTTEKVWWIGATDGNRIESCFNAVREE